MHDGEPEVGGGQPLRGGVAQHPFDVFAHVVYTLAGLVGAAPGFPHDPRHVGDDVVQSLALLGDFGEQPLSLLLGEPLFGDIPEDADRHVGPPGAVAHCGGLDDGPVLLSGGYDAPADQGVGALLALERQASRQRGPPFPEVAEERPQGDQRQEDGGAGRPASEPQQGGRGPRAEKWG